MTAMRLKSASVAAAAVCAIWGAAAQAAIYDITLTGVVANGAYSSQDIGADHFDQWSLGLSGVDGGSPLTVAEGDTINATITLDELFTIPASADLTSFVLFLGASGGFPAGDVGASGSFIFYNGLDVAASGGSGTTTSGQIAHSVVFFPPDNGAITFDSVFASFTIDDLPAAVTLDYSGVSYTLFDIGGAVPEPASWALMILGFAGAGAALRRRRVMAAPTNV